MPAWWSIEAWQPQRGEIHSRTMHRAVHRAGQTVAIECVDVGRRDRGVGVQQQHVGAGNEPVGEADIDPRGEAAVAARIEVARAELGAERCDLRQRRVVDDRDGQVAHGLERPAQQVGGAVGDDHDFYGARGGSGGGAVRRP